MSKPKITKKVYFTLLGKGGLSKSTVSEWLQQYFISNPILLPSDIESGLYILSINTSESNFYSTKVYKY